MESTDIISIDNCRKNPNEYTIGWKVTYLCNYSCAFCIQGDRNAHISRAKGESREIRGRITDRLVSFIETDLDRKTDRLRINLIGGEIMILPDITDILQKLLDASFHGVMSIHITTNLSCKEETLRSLRSLFDKRKNRRLSLSCSFYKEYTDFEAFYARFSILKSRKRLHFAGILSGTDNICANIGYPILDDADCRDFEAVLERHPSLKGCLSPIWIREYKTSVSPEAQSRIQHGSGQAKNLKVSLADGRTVFLSGMNEMPLLLGENRVFDPAGCLCDVGTRYISISPTGQLSVCPSEELVKVYEGNILTQDPEFSSGMVPCRIRRCGCTNFGRIERGTPKKQSD